MVSHILHDGVLFLRSESHGFGIVEIFWSFNHRVHIEIIRLCRITRNARGPFSFYNEDGVMH